MDPLATLRLAQEAIDDLAMDPSDRNARRSFRQAMADYSAWRADGGFEPTLPSGMSGDKEAAYLRECFKDITETWRGRRSSPVEF